eukprot:5074678-Pyramimonas_sp.AAC.1
MKFTSCRAGTPRPEGRSCDCTLIQPGYRANAFRRRSSTDPTRVARCSSADVIYKHSFNLRHERFVPSLRPRVRRRSTASSRSRPPHGGPQRPF